MYSRSGLDLDVDIKGILEYLAQSGPKKMAHVYCGSPIHSACICQFKLYQSLTCSRRSRARIIANAVAEVCEVSITRYIRGQRGC